jgi:hypothetical protein
LRDVYTNGRVGKVIVFVAGICCAGMIVIPPLNIIGITPIH